MSASLGQTGYHPDGVWGVGQKGHFRALPVLMLALLHRAGQGLYYFTICLRRALDTPQYAWLISSDARSFTERPPCASPGGLS
jgi:hypothetical protein